MKTIKRVKSKRAPVNDSAPRAFVNGTVRTSKAGMLLQK